MSKIKVLSEAISNRIAAGEVIERPASVVKELVENAVDAGATAIVVEIEKAGQKLIAVTDNGSGMDADDALMCLEPHATSKIRAADDIDHIITLGFRGEAIPSIAAVSRFSLVTRLYDSREGFEVKAHGGKIIAAEPAGCAPGTRVEARDLFFNVPARKKFMRAASTEESHIQEILYMLSLPYPLISFELIMDGRKSFSSPAHDGLMPRIKTFFGKNYADYLLPVDYADDGISVSGFAARHGLTRGSRREQRTFFNGRPVESPAAYRGLRDGYGGLLEKGRFPPCILFIRLDPQDIDVNVHPAKREIRLKQEYKVSGVIAAAVRTALKQAPTPSVTLDAAIPLKSLLSGAQIRYTPPAAEQADLEFNSPSADELPVGNELRPEPKPDSSPARDSTVPEEPPPRPAAENAAAGSLPDCGAVQILGFIDETYVLGAGGGGLVVIDQHAAHERIMFERLLNAARQGVASQQLLLPITLELSRAEAAYVSKNSENFLELGFETDALSSNTIILNAIPASLSQQNADGLFRDILSELLDEGRTSGKADLEALARASCKAAVKAHDCLTPEEAGSLLRQLAQCELPFSCPHGRPTIISIPVKELERRFGRK
ncbi:MAG: DNA mismatch repair endonuclease MutL [Victivallaceae bacterium]|nr:DNA mismatch repair endonuclease MutL [Victivallaceae bacterium]